MIAPNPHTLRDKAFEAFCSDLLEGKGFQRTDALRAVRREMKKGPAA